MNVGVDPADPSGDRTVRILFDSDTEQVLPPDTHIRIVRVIEYEGPADEVFAQIDKSVADGEWRCRKDVVMRVHTVQMPFVPQTDPAKLNYPQGNHDPRS